MKNGNKWFEVETSDVFDWSLEVRSEYQVAGTYRIGEMFIKQNTRTGDLSMSLREEIIPKEI